MNELTFKKKPEWMFVQSKQAPVGDKNVRKYYDRIKQNKIKYVNTLFFVVAVVVFWCSVKFCNYVRRKYRNTRIMRIKTISADQQRKWMLEKNEQNKRTAETLIVNTESDGSNSTYPVLLLFPVFYFLCCWCINFLKIISEQKWNWRLS